MVMSNNNETQMAAKIIFKNGYQLLQQKISLRNKNFTRTYFLHSNYL